MLTAEIVKALKAPFSPEDHKERSLPGGGRWFFISYQKIRDRLSEICLDWEVSYADPTICGEMVVVRCRLTIEGVTREGMGNSKAYPDKQGYGTPIELARADAFKEAAEMFGVGAYLDSQDFVVKYLHSKGDYRGVKFAQENDWKAKGAMGTPKTPAPTQNGSPGIVADRAYPSQAKENRVKKISSDQAETFRAIATASGYTNQGAVALLQAHGISRSTEIPESLYQQICAQASDRELAKTFNESKIPNPK